MTKEFSIVVCVLGLMLLLGCASETPIPIPPTPTPNPSNLNSLAQKLDRYLTRRARNQEFSGVVLVAQYGKILLKKAYGFAESDQEIPNTTETRFQLASVAKTITATAIMMLVERGQIQLQSPISTYLADTPEEWKNITVQHLLSHTSGIPDYFSFDEFEHEMNLTPSGVIQVAKTYPLDFPPGSEFSYTNTGYVLLGKIIEEVSGKTYAQFLRETIFDPLQMNATGRDGNNEPSATGYVSYGEPADMFPITNALGDGDLFSTVDDLYQFDRALYEETFLPRTARETMFTSVGQNNYGSGWEVTTWKHKRVVSHSGGINGFATELMRFPDDNTVLIVLSNIESFDAVQAAWEMAEILYP
jgi:CubicO group peptidase (beta-lactamase class C family)